MQKLINFDFDSIQEGEQEIQVSFCSLLMSKYMSDGYVIESGTRLMMLSEDEGMFQVETVFPDGEPAGVIFWVNDTEVDNVSHQIENFSPDELSKIKGKVLGGWI